MEGGEFVVGGFADGRGHAGEQVVGVGWVAAAEAVGTDAALAVLGAAGCV